MTAKVGSFPDQQAKMGGGKQLVNPRSFQLSKQPRDAIKASTLQPMALDEHKVKGQKSNIIDLRQGPPKGSRANSPMSIEGSTRPYQLH